MHRHHAIACLRFGALLALASGAGACGEPASLTEEWPGLGAEMGQVDQSRADMSRDMPTPIDMTSPDMNTAPDMTSPDMASDMSTPDMAPPDMGPACTLGEGSHCDPIVITSFPFMDTRDTTLAAPSYRDRYDCAPDTNESGREFYYTFEVATAGTLTATVDDVSGDSVDIDVHLLRDGDPATAMCLARDNVMISLAIEPGRYTLALDTWVNSSGAQLAGPYTLSVTWAP